MYKISFFVPESHKEQVKTAMFRAGAGKIGNYDCCSFETKGTGQFRALNGSDPYVGKVGELELVTEFKVELVVDDQWVKTVLAAMKESHPYETPAYDVWKLEDL